MWIEREPHADPELLEQTLRGLGLWLTRWSDPESGREGYTIAGHSSPVSPEHLRALPGVAAVFAPDSSHPRVDAQRHRAVTITESVSVGGPAPPVLMAGPCAVETEERIRGAAAMARRAGALLLRGGAYKPRTSPYSFQGVGAEGLVWLRRAADEHGLGVVTEILDPADAPRFAELVDLIQIGSRNMQNYALLKAVGRCGRPVLLKRGASATVHAWMLAGEHLLAAGAPGVIFCERGVRGFDPATRNLLDLGAVTLLKHAHGQPIIVDPSHATGRRELVTPLARAAIAAGADGLLIEAHPEPGAAWSDAAQSLDPEGLLDLSRAAQGIRPFAKRAPQRAAEPAPSL